MVVDLSTWCPLLNNNCRRTHVRQQSWRQTLLSEPHGHPGDSSSGGPRGVHRVAPNGGSDQEPVLTSCSASYDAWETQEGWQSPPTSGAYAAPAAAARNEKAQKKANSLPFFLLPRKTSELCEARINSNCDNPPFLSLWQDLSVI